MKLKSEEKKILLVKEIVNSSFFFFFENGLHYWVQIIVSTKITAVFKRENTNGKFSMSSVGLVQLSDFLAGFIFALQTSCLN